MSQDLPSENTADSVDHRRSKVLSTAYTAVPSDEKDDNPKIAVVRSNWWRRIMLDTWAPELIAITFSTACLVAIAAVLFVYKDKTTPHLPYDITLNAVISILATASRSLLIFTVAAAIGQLKWCWYRHERGVTDIQSFDDASRGPWGSMMLLFSWRAQSLAALGASITVLALAFDPFVQQILTYPTKMVFVPAAYSSVMRTPSYVAFDPGDDEWLNAISSGVWSGSTQLMRPPTCASGTCTWPEPVRSVGWCSKCVDALPYAKLTHCDYADVEGNGQPTNQTMQSANGTKCIVDFGHGNKLQLLDPGKYRTEWLVDTGVSLTQPDPIIAQHSVWHLGDHAVDYNKNDPGLTVNHNVNSTPSEPFLSVTNPILTLGRVSVGLIDTNNGFSSIDHITEAEECVLSLCERTFNVSVVNATASFELLQTDYGTRIWLETTETTETYGTNNDPIRFQTNSSLTCWQPGEAAYHVVNYTNISTDLDAMCDYAGAETPYFCPSGLNWYCHPSSEGFAYTLLERLAGNITMASRGINPGGYNVDVTKWIIAQNLSTVLDSVAASLTQLGLSANTTDQVRGLAYQREVHVSVAWVWLSLPIALTLGSILLLIAAAVQSKRYKVKLWKSSVLPLLYHGFEDGRLGGNLVPEAVSGMAEVAGGEKMQIVGSSLRRRTALS
ncbi:hypothetical protein LTR97_012038 [Elasticomyces elasticus]|uniref:Uncharacterized protein n=1 Tax=Elasticomyces elasticus TaxID=574655 RepID=A0AAN7VRL4_9PEZI|nr:hypothetical protein LTR97_012038 [Elasticomyces elasticus]